MIEKLETFIQRHDSFVITTHDPADADGLGAEFVIACILRKRKKTLRIINSGPVPKFYQFMDPKEIIEQWDEKTHGALAGNSALIIVDTAEENYIGDMKKAVPDFKEIFIMDHHEPKPGAVYSGIIDSAASSSCEMAVELAVAAGVVLDHQTAIAAYTGIVYDTGFFSYSKTGPRTFKAALVLLGSAVNPAEIYRRLCESSPTRALLLQKRAFAGLALHCRDRVASQILRKEDFTETGAEPTDTEGFVNIPLKSRDIIVSILLKESKDGVVRCSLRSKGKINVAKIAQHFGGGGHVNAAGYEINQCIDKTLAMALVKITEILDSNEKK